MFADDSLIYVTGESSIELKHKSNLSVSIVENWINR